MHRRPNTDIDGKTFSEEVVEAVWQKARTMGTSAILRVDAWGWTIVRQDYGNARSRYGWEIDHIIPVSEGGTDDLSNLQPLQWENNRRKDQLHGMTPTSSDVNSQSRQESSDPRTAPHKKRHRNE